MHVAFQRRDLVFVDEHQKIAGMGEVDRLEPASLAGVEVTVASPPGYELDSHEAERIDDWRRFSASHASVDASSVPPTQ